MNGILFTSKAIWQEMYKLTNQIHGVLLYINFFYRLQKSKFLQIFVWQSQQTIPIGIPHGSRSVWLVDLLFDVFLIWH